jgi:SAM-dependent methyltransferase
MSVAGFHRSLKMRWKRFRSARWRREYSDALAEPDYRKRFDRLYAQRLWSRIAGTQETGCGGGSTLEATQIFRDELERFLSAQAPGVFFDAPCGDFYFMSRVRFPPGWTYIGGDISPAALRDARQVAPGRDFREFDLLTDPFPASDAWLCRACLFHLCFADIRMVLENFARSDGKLAIITSHTGVPANVDMPTGDYRPLDLTAPPINLPKPARFLRDLSTVSSPWVAGIWSRQEIASALAAAPRAS